LSSLFILFILYPRFKQQQQQQKLALEKKLLKQKKKFISKPIRKTKQ
jgi:hypothetical protein